jgi:hypothetical protein
VRANVPKSRGTRRGGEGRNKKRLACAACSPFLVLAPIYEVLLKMLEVRLTHHTEYAPCPRPVPGQSNRLLDSELCHTVGHTQAPLNSWAVQSKLRGLPSGAINRFFTHDSTFLSVILHLHLYK